MAKARKKQTDEISMENIENVQPIEMVTNTESTSIEVSQKTEPTKSKEIKSNNTYSNVKILIAEDFYSDTIENSQSIVPESISNRQFGDNYEVGMSNSILKSLESVKDEYTAIILKLNGVDLLKSFDFEKYKKEISNKLLFFGHLSSVPLSRPFYQSEDFIFAKTSTLVTLFKTINQLQTDNTHCYIIGEKALQIHTISELLVLAQLRLNKYGIDNYGRNVLLSNLNDLLKAYFIIISE